MSKDIEKKPKRGRPTKAEAEAKKAEAVLKKVEEKQEEDVKVSPEEKALIKAKREENQRRLDCSNEMQGVLKKYRCTVIIDPNSPFGRPAIIVKSL